MPMIELKLDGDGAWPDLATVPPDRLINLMTGATGRDTRIGLACLPSGTVGGRPTVTIRIDLPDGRVLLTETTLRVLGAAVDAMRARYGA